MQKHRHEPDIPNRAAGQCPPLLPGFQTPRLRLRRRSLADADACLAMDHEPDVPHFAAGPWSAPEAHRAFIEARTRPLAARPWVLEHLAARRLG